MFSRNFEADYRAIEAALEAKEPFALSRFGDGEWSLLVGRPYKSASGWVSKGETPLRGALLESLRCDLGGYCVGYSPPCCHPKCVGFYAENVKVPKLRRTFATVFFHGNFMRAKAYFSRLDAALVGCTEGADIRVPKDAVNHTFDVDDVVQQMLEVRDRPILVAAGPSACILVHRYWNWTKREPERRVPCIDIGALLDERSHGRRTRHYHDPKSGLHGHYCKWDDWSSAKQRRVVGVHNAVKGSFTRDVRAPNAMKSPMQQVADRRGSGARPKWLERRPTGKAKKRR